MVSHYVTLPTTLTHLHQINKNKKWTPRDLTDLQKEKVEDAGASDFYLLNDTDNDNDRWLTISICFSNERYIHTYILQYANSNFCIR